MSALTFQGISLPFASRILAWNLRRFPNGIFFLLGAGRLAQSSALPAKSIENYKKAIRAQGQYRNLHFVSFWEMAVAGISEWILDPVPEEAAEPTPTEKQTKPEKPVNSTAGEQGITASSSESESTEQQTPPTPRSELEPNNEPKEAELKAPSPRRAKTNNANISTTLHPSEAESEPPSTPHKIQLQSSHNVDLSRCKGQLGLGNWEVLSEEGTWSPAVYVYARGACLLEIAGIKADRARAKKEEKGDDTNIEDDGSKEREEARKLLERVGGLGQKIAGKSIPIEVSNQLFKHF